MTPVAAFVAGGIVATVIAFIVMGRIVTVSYTRQRQAETVNFSLVEHIKHLEAQRSPLYQIRTDGVSPVAQRNPHPIPDLEPVGTEPWGEDFTSPVKIGDQDVWDSAIGGYRNVH